MSTTPETPKNEPTSEIDLGDDLLLDYDLEHQSPSPDVKGEPKSAAPQPVPKAMAAVFDEELERARILFSERLLDDAKKIFRKILIKNPLHADAQQYLKEIQNIEIQELLSGDSSRRKIGDSEQEPVALTIDRLDKDLGLNLERFEYRAVPSIFKTHQDEVDFTESLLTEQVPSLSVAQQIDLGIAFLEMALFYTAQKILEWTLINLEQQVERAPNDITLQSQRLSAAYLLGYSLILGGKAVDATIRLEPIARDLSLSEKQKIDFIYLMGVAFEQMQDNRKAKESFKRVMALNPKYRDVAERLKVHYS